MTFKREWMTRSRRPSVTWSAGIARGTRVFFCGTVVFLRIRDASRYSRSFRGGNITAQRNWTKNAKVDRKNQGCVGINRNIYNLIVVVCRHR